jgi:glycosyltransferase involved in cell wall biosynthesis
MDSNDFCGSLFGPANVIPTSSNRFLPFYQAHFNSLVSRYKPDIIISGSFFVPPACSAFKTILILYDLLCLTEPGFFISKGRLFQIFARSYFKYFIPRSLANSKMHGCISYSTLGELNRIFPALSKGVYIGAGLDSAFFNHKRGENNGNFVLIVGNTKSYKNLPNQIIAFSHIKKSFPHFRLKLLLKQDHSVSSINHFLTDLNLFEDTDFLGYMSEKDLIILYQTASLVLFVSKQEGFGFPLLEAMALGAPIITSNQSSLKEIMDFAPTMADPQNPKDIANKAISLLSDSTILAQSVDRNYSQALKYTWPAVIKRMFSVFYENSY